MFIYTAKFSKRRAFSLIALLAAIIAVGFFLCSSLPDNNEISAANDAERIAYLHSLGWETEAPAVETVALTLPDPLEEPYLSYNVLQQQQGFDLQPYAGKNIERSTYTVTNHPSALPCQANLYTHHGKLIAGDILCSGEGGFIAPLTFPGSK